jgi:hypothetical protein
LRRHSQSLRAVGLGTAKSVRVTAASLVLAFCGLGLLTSEKLFIGAALIGVGLVFAGVSNTCMMASVLGRMPWNHPHRANS